MGFDHCLSSNKKTSRSLSHARLSLSLSLFRFQSSATMATEGKVRLVLARSAGFSKGRRTRKRKKEHSLHPQTTVFCFSTSSGKQKNSNKKPQQPIECLAAVAWEARKPLDVTEVVIGPPQKGEVRIKVR